MLVGRRSIDRLERSPQVVGDDVLHAVDAAGADDVEESGGELRERGADASARDDGGAAAAKEIRELAHAVEVRLQAGQEHQVVSRAARRIERPVPVLVVQAHVEVPRVDQGADVQAGDRLHEVARCAACRGRGAGARRRPARSSSAAVPGSYPPCVTNARIAAAPPAAYRSTRPLRRGDCTQLPDERHRAAQKLD